MIRIDALVWLLNLSHKLMTEVKNLVNGVTRLNSFFYIWKWVLCIFQKCEEHVEAPVIKKEIKIFYRPLWKTQFWRKCNNHSWDTYWRCGSYATTTGKSWFTWNTMTPCRGQESAGTDWRPFSAFSRILLVFFTIEPTGNSLC